MPLEATGYVKRTALEIQEALIEKLQQVCPEFQHQPADIQSNLLDAAVQPLMEYENLMAECINSFAPGAGSEFIFRQLASAMGLIPKSEKKATVLLTFTGPIGTIIPQDCKVSDGNGHTFSTVEAIILPLNGSKSVEATADTLDLLAAGTLTNILTSVPQGVQCTNQSQSEAYTDEETFAELKARAQARIRSARFGGVDYATSLLASVEGVEPRQIAFFSKEVDSSQAGKRVQGIEAVVGGGDIYEVAYALARSFLETQKLVSVPSGLGDQGRTIVVPITYASCTREVRFTRPTRVGIALTLFIGFRNAVISDTALMNLVKQDYIDYVNAKQVGSLLTKYELTAILLEKMQENSIDIKEVSLIDWSAAIDGTVGNWTAQGYLQGVEHDMYMECDSFIITRQ